LTVLTVTTRLPHRDDPHRVLKRPRSSLRLIAAVAHLRIGRLLAQSHTAASRHAPETRRAPTHPHAHQLGSFIDESVEGSTAIQQASSMANLNGKPLIVLTAVTYDPKWQPAQKHIWPSHIIDQQSARSRQRHHPTNRSSTTNPTPPAAIQTARDVVASLRTGPLAPH
jgi:hypothetical protein